MGRPSTVKLGGVLYWTIHTVGTNGRPIEVDNPSVEVRSENDVTSLTVVAKKRAGSTGIVDCNCDFSDLMLASVNDTFEFIETVEIEGEEYVNSFYVRMVQTPWVATNRSLTSPANITTDGTQIDAAAMATMDKQGDILAKLQSSPVLVQSPVPEAGLIKLILGDTYDGSGEAGSHPKLDWPVEKNYSSADSIVLKIYNKEDIEDVRLEATATADSPTLVAITTLTATFTPALEFKGDPLRSRLAFSLVATKGTGENEKTETIDSGVCWVTARP